MPNGNPHDALFKDVFGRAEHAAGLLASLLPAELRARLDLAAAERVPGSFVDRALRQRHSDLLYRVELDGREAYVYVLLEHQSSQDPLMGFRLLRYQVRIWERWLRKHPGARRLPAVLPVVVYHGERVWSEPVAFEELLDLDPDARDLLRPFVPGFRFLLDDLAGRSDAELRTRALGALARLTLLLFKHARGSGDLRERLAAWIELLRQVASSPTAEEDLTRLLQYLLQVAGISEDELGAFLRSQLGPREEALVTTAGERLLQKGRQEGRQEGRQQERRELLLRLLQAKFGDLSPQQEERVRRAGFDELDRCALQLVHADALNDVLPGSSEDPPRER